MKKEPFKLFVNRVITDVGTESCIGVMVSEDLRITLATVENRRFLIPDGRYDVTFTFSPRFSKKDVYSRYMDGKVPLILVPGHHGIRIHIANYGYQLSGCVGIGRGLGVTMIGDSRLAYIDFMKAVEKYDPTCDKGLIQFHTLDTCKYFEYMP